MTTASRPLEGGHAPRLYVVLLATLVCLAGTSVVLLGKHDSGSTSSSSASVEGSGKAAAQTRALPPFTAIELAGANNLVVRVGGRQSVVVHADDNLMDLVTTDVRDGKLVVGTRGNFETKTPMSVHVTVPLLAGADLTGSGVVVVTGVHAEHFVIRVPGSGVVVAHGTVGRLNAGIAGSGDLRLRDLLAQNATATVSGSGRLEVFASRSLAASVTRRRGDHLQRKPRLGHQEHHRHRFHHAALGMLAGCW